MRGTLRTASIVLTIMIAKTPREISSSLPVSLMPKHRQKDEIMAITGTGRMLSMIGSKK